MGRIFDAKKYDDILKQLNSTDVESLHRSFDFLKEITIKLLTNLLILNGGAVVVTLTFVGTLINGSNSRLVSSFVEPLLCFSISSAISVFLCGVTYWSQSLYTAADSLKVSINEIYLFLFFNQQKREFYTSQYLVQNEEENNILQNLIKSLDKNDERYEKNMECLKKDIERNNCQGDICRCVAIILFIISLCLFLYGVYLMGNIFWAFDNVN